MAKSHCALLALEFVLLEMMSAHQMVVQAGKEK